MRLHITSKEKCHMTAVPALLTDYAPMLQWWS